MRVVFQSVELAPVVREQGRKPPVFFDRGIQELHRPDEILVVVVLLRFVMQGVHLVGSGGEQQHSNVGDRVRVVEELLG